ncbi:hypothetical protein HHUSO_G36805 [Huso huso]|uniref:Uncharacterized protein n=1 Tax=Huso huso TaxID=61971 RepID=A0ABR0Y119_HUSHU
MAALGSSLVGYGVSSESESEGDADTAPPPKRPNNDAGKSGKNFLVESGDSSSSSGEKKTAPTGTRTRSPSRLERLITQNKLRLPDWEQAIRAPASSVTLQGGEERAAERLAETRASDAAAQPSPDRRQAGVSPLSQAGAMSPRTQMQVRSRQRPADPGAAGAEPHGSTQSPPCGASGPPDRSEPASPNREEETGFEQHSGAGQAPMKNYKAQRAREKPVGAVEREGGRKRRGGQRRERGGDRGERGEKGT